MPSEGDSFLPRIQSVFYAVFDVQKGPKIVYQVPEGLIATSGPSNPALGAVYPSAPPTPSIETPPSAQTPSAASRNSSISLVSPVDYQRPNSRNLYSPSHKQRSGSSNRILFNFDDISKYVIPPSPLCGRLVTCATKHYRIVGHPVALEGAQYERNYLYYNVCFVFERSADVSCYEPIVRKVNRVLTSCEEESKYISCPPTPDAMQAILEQLFEDLNSYSETAIPIDHFNSIQLKIFPFYPNPPPVHDWMVPVALINLKKAVEDDWDLTMVKICKFIDGTNHVSRIAHLADCDPVLTREAISHLLYYQVIMTIDIFQFSNVYTLRRSIQWLAEEPHVKEECGPYVTRPGQRIPDWPKLLHLYSRFRSGKTVQQWMEAYDVHELGIDARRFTSFGVIKGFLRRVHRWPVLLPPPALHHNTPETPITPLDATATTRKRVASLSSLSQYPVFSPDATPTLPPAAHQAQLLFRGNLAGGAYHPAPNLGTSTPPTHATLSGATTPTLASPAVPAVASPVPAEASADVLTYAFDMYRARQASAAERALEHLRNKDSAQTRWSALAASVRRPGSPLMSLPPLAGRAQENGGRGQEHGARGPGLESRRQSLMAQGLPPPSPNIKIKTTSASHRHRQAATGDYRQPNAGDPRWAPTSDPKNCPPELIPLLDGEHHTDELSVRFEAGWPLLQQWLAVAGGGTGEDGDFGRVCVIYR
ncbi:NPR2-domain-containing protein [Schizophyllum commune H4-8]|uniref:NPR2-domain-containing protein n=1 Tax=Schizophyllum commune (strain H4-8 / FGSC 9210) TaxID=578458 RepID=UPI00215E826A|nr:NPR2-domain-containing protein [Schizophyllum commune H4-8]KAI5900317.1 NPR2-domain-containing protein [Schizophyllum commune H4-8]